MLQVWGQIDIDVFLSCCVLAIFCMCFLELQWALSAGAMYQVKRPTFVKSSFSNVRILSIFCFVFTPFIIKNWIVIIITDYGYCEKTKTHLVLTLFSLKCSFSYDQTQKFRLLERKSQNFEGETFKIVWSKSSSVQKNIWCAWFVALDLIILHRKSLNQEKV